MEKSFEVVRRSKVILVPYPAQGHVTPITKLALALHGHGFDPILVVPGYLHRIVAPNIPRPIECVPIPDDIDEDSTPRDFFAVEKAMEENMPAHLESFVKDLAEVAFIIVDLIASWAIEVADRCCVPVAGFFTAMMDVYEMITAIPNMVRDGVITELGLPQDEEKVSFLKKRDDDQSRLLLSTEDLPWLIGTLASRKARFQFWIRTLNRWTSLQWIVVNSFPHDIIDLKDCERDRGGDVRPRIFLVGPLDLVAVTKNPSFWEEDESCLCWLNQQEPDSVIYISFGSWVSPIGEANLNNLALSLKKSGKPFLWVLGKNWRNGPTEGYLNGALNGRGKVVSWAPQLEVLNNEAVGCYLTHCGWNSTMEAIQCKKRMICYPVAGDQFVNCKYITQVWKVGVQIAGFRHEEFEEGLARVMEDHGIGARLDKLRDRVMGEAAVTRVEDNLDDFVDDMKRLIKGAQYHPSPQFNQPLGI